MDHENEENERNNENYEDKKMESEEKCNEKSKRLDSDMQHLLRHLLEMAYELLNKDVCEKLSMLKDEITRILELKPLLLSITDELKETFFSGITDEIIHPKRNDSIIECNVSDASSEADLVINESENEDENRTQQAGKHRQKVGENEETDNTKGRNRKLSKPGSDKNLILDSSNAYNQLQTIKNESEKQRALSFERFQKLIKLGPSLINTRIGIDKGRYLTEETKEDEAFAVEVWEKKNEKIEQNSDEGQPHPEEKREAMRPRCNSVSLLRSVIRSKFPSLLFYKPGSQTSLVPKAMNSVNELPDFKQLFYFVCLKFSIAREIVEVEKAQDKKNFAFKKGDLEEEK